MIDENADKKGQNSGNDENDDHGEVTENQRRNLVNVLQNNISLSSENLEGMSEVRKMMIKNITEMAEHGLYEEVNGFKKVDKNLLKDWAIKVNHVLKEIKSVNMTETNRLIRACVIFVGTKVGLKPNQRKKMQLKKNTTANTRVE